MAATTRIDQAACRTHDSDGELWFSDTAADRALAMHLCLKHCPLLDACREARQNPAHGVWAGRLYNAAGQADARNLHPSARDCPTCPIAADDNRKPATPFPDCGSLAAHSRHTRRGEKPCEPCMQAIRNRDAGRRAAKRRQDAVSRDERTAQQKNRAQQRVERRENLVHRIRGLSGAGLTDPDVATVLAIPRHTVRRLRRLNGIAAGSKTTRTEAA